jgi:hypothetical protein
MTKPKGAITLKSLLAEATSNAGTFKYGNPGEVAKAVADAEARIAALASILKSVQDRRNEAMAHLDPRTVADPAALAVRAKLTVPDLKTVFSETGAILNEFSRLWHDTTSIMQLIDDTDYASALDLIADAKHAQVDKYESEFKAPCPFPRPRKSKNPW